MNNIFEKSVAGRRGVRLTSATEAELATALPLPASLCAAAEAELPQVSELDAIRHFTTLSQRNFSIDTNFYPLGSCTMKYNPRICEKCATLEGFTALHPLTAQLPGGEALSQGALELLYRSEELLCELTGMHGFTLQPLAGAHGELVGMLLIAAYHRARGERRTQVLVPDSAHGTNPASAAIAGFEVVTLPTDSEGNVDLAQFEAHLTPAVAGVMLTCPNTLGLFESHILRMAELAHANGTLLYYDGANMNALMGRARPGDLGFDVVHLNIHKTLATPHGGGGPGGGPVGVKAELLPFLPLPRPERQADGFKLGFDYPHSIGPVAPFYGNFAVIVRAYTYLLHLGGAGLRRATDHAVLNANYLRVRLQEAFELPYPRICMHEVVFSARRQAARGVRALDLAKGLIDAGYHPPTVYFPLVVAEALMIEPTESESKETLDEFVAEMLRLAQLAETHPESFALMPLKRAVSRVDETRAARNLKLRA